MRCKECGELAQNPTLRFCENCGAKMPAPPRGSSIRPAVRGTGRASAEHAALARTDGEDTDPGAGPKEPERTRPPYDGPAWLAPVPGHSPSVAGIGLLGVALVLGILPFFAGVGPFWGLVTLMGGWLVTARELHETGERHPLVDWVPPALLRPVVPAVYAAVMVALAVRMLGLGLTPLLWLGGAGLLAHDQYRKVYQGPEGWSRLFEPRQLLSGMTPVALGGVVGCLLALFLTWTPVASTTSRYSAPVPVPGGPPPELRVVDAPRPADDAVYRLFDGTGTGWELPLAIAVELLLLGALAVLALRPEVPRPQWLRWVPVGAVGAGLLWGLLHVKLLPGPLMFLVGLAAVGFVAVPKAFSRE